MNEESIKSQCSSPSIVLLHKSINILLNFSTILFDCCWYRDVLVFSIPSKKTQFMDQLALKIVTLVSVQVSWCTKSVDAFTKEYTCICNGGSLLFLDEKCFSSICEIICNCRNILICSVCACVARIGPKCPWQLCLKDFHLKKIIAFVL